MKPVADVTTAAGLPHAAAVELLSDPRQVCIVRVGCSGYWPITRAYSDTEAATIRALINTALGVTPPQLEAMTAGSMFGWHCPAADPASYDENGNIKRAAPDAA